MSDYQESDPWESVYNPDQDRHDLECLEDKVEHLSYMIEKIKRAWSITLVSKGMQLNSAENLISDICTEIEKGRP